ncbi:carboxymuconolactone decarboxylase family protein [Arthrobacter ramosus]|uniref:Carboxymuconolactone decarboxylase family protein n=1 Tax=Arthrobacter ramosus TaxID=1672 RepID=A0ABV5XUV6_ARTRM|nr:carboxymuconolactone decarboxylase family protein [Arthrobacter ramosus]
MSENTPKLAGYLDKQQPGLYQALSGYAEQVTAEADRTGIPRRTLELLNYRASQINGCAFCLDLHHRRAIGYGETEQRLSLVSVHGEVGLFDEAEQVALELAEQITRPEQRPPHGGVVFPCAGGLHRGADQRAVHGVHRYQRVQPLVHPERTPGAQGPLVVVKRSKSPDYSQPRGGSVPEFFRLLRHHR